MALVSAPGSPRKSIADLKGAKLGLSSPGSSSHLNLSFILSRENVRPEEVMIVGIGTLSTAVAVMERGCVEAGIMFFKRAHGFPAPQPVSAHSRRPAATRRAPKNGRCERPCRDLAPPPPKSGFGRMRNPLKRSARR